MSKIIIVENGVLEWDAYIEGRPDLLTGAAESRDRAVGQVVLLNSEVLNIGIETWERHRVPSPAGGKTPDMSRPPRLVR